MCLSVCLSVCLYVCLCLCVDESSDQSWSTVNPAVLSPATVKSSSTLPVVDNLVIDNMDELPVMDRSTDNVSQLSKTLIEFLLTRHVTRCYSVSHY